MEDEFHFIFEDSFSSLSHVNEDFYSSFDERRIFDVDIPSIFVKANQEENKFFSSAKENEDIPLLFPLNGGGEDMTILAEGKVEFLPEKSETFFLNESDLTTEKVPPLTPHERSTSLSLKNQLRKCTIPGCYRSGRFHFKKDKFQIVCDKHKCPGMVRINFRICETEGCELTANYGFTDRVRCKSHSEEGMIYLPHAKLSQLPPPLGEKQRKPKRRVLQTTIKKIHYSLPPIENEKSGIDEGVSREALNEKVSLSVEGNSQKRFNFHIKDSARASTGECYFVDDDGNKCMAASRFGYLSDKMKIACKKHATPGMVTLTRRNLCKAPGCGKEASFGQKKGNIE